jgi:hypothetical protein
MSASVALKTYALFALFRLTSCSVSGGRSFSSFYLEAEVATHSERPESCRLRTQLARTWDRGCVTNPLVATGQFRRSSAHIDNQAFVDVQYAKDNHLTRSAKIVRADDLSTVC